MAEVDRAFVEVDLRRHVLLHIGVAGFVGRVRQRLHNVWLYRSRRLVAERRNFVHRLLQDLLRELLHRDLLRLVLLFGELFHDFVEICQLLLHPDLLFSEHLLLLNPRVAGRNQDDRLSKLLAELVVLLRVLFDFHQWDDGG